MGLREDFSLRKYVGERVVPLLILMMLAYFYDTTIFVDQAYATPLTLRLNDSLIADARNNNRNGVSDDDHYELIINRLSISGQYEGYMFNGRLDTMYFQNEPTSDFQTVRIRPERASLSKHWRFSKGKALFVEAGDFYQQLGKGQLLALRKVDELGVDISLRGGKINARTREFNLQLFGGVSNVVNVDMVSMHHVEDQNDVIVGGQSGYRLPIGGEAGVMYVFLGPEDQTIDGLQLNDATSSGGVYVNLPALSDFLSLYGEFDTQQRRLIEVVQEGYAGYLTLDWHFADTTFLTEGLWVDNFEQRGSNNTALVSRFNYNQGPTLERIDQEVAEMYDVRGGRVRIQQDLMEGDLSLHMNGLFRNTKPNDPMELTQYHGYGGAEWYYDLGRSRLSASGGHRFDMKEGYINRVWSHAEGDFVQRLWGTFAAHFTTQFQRIQIEQQPFFTRGSTVFGFEKSGLGSVSMEWGVDTQNRSEGVRQQFFAGIFNWDISRLFLLKATVGNQRGGIKCVGGVCRDFPEFSGYRLQIIARHDLSF